MAFWRYAVASWEKSFGTAAWLSFEVRSSAAIERTENKTDGESIDIGRIMERHGLSQESIHGNLEESMAE